MSQYIQRCSWKLSDCRNLFGLLDIKEDKVPCSNNNHTWDLASFSLDSNLFIFKSVFGERGSYHIDFWQLFCFIVSQSTKRITKIKALIVLLKLVDVIITSITSRCYHKHCYQKCRPITLTYIISRSALINNVLGNGIARSMPNFMNYTLRYVQRTPK